MTAQTILPANTLSSGYDVANSLMFNDGDSAYLDKTPSGDGSRVKWTWSGWVKRCSFGHQPIFSTPGNSSNIYDEFYFNSTDKIQYSAVVSGTQYALRTTRTFKDVGAWYHIVLIFDSNNATAGDRMQLWINGVRTAEADMEDTTFKDAQNYSSSINNDKIHYLGKVTTNTAGIFDGYMAEVVFQNNSADSPVDKFGEFDSDSGIFKPIDVSSLTDANIVTITHNLGTADIVVQVYDKTTEANIMCDIARTTDDFSTASTSVVSIDFGTAPPNDCRALITSLAGATAGSIAYT